MHDFCSPVCAGHPHGMDVPESEMIFIFQKVKPTWNQTDLSSVYMAAICMLVALKKHKLCQPAWWQTRSGGSHYKVWLAEDSLTGCRAAWCREELQSKRSQSCKWIIIKQMQSNWTTVWKWKKLKNLLKCPLVNETLWPETETRPRRLAFSPRRDRDLPTLCRDRDEMFEKYVSRRSRDRDVETETTTLDDAIHINMLTEHNIYQLWVWSSTRKQCCRKETAKSQLFFSVRWQHSLRV